MKNLKIILIAVFTAFLFQSCSEDESQESKIIGIWKVDNIEFDVSINDQGFSEFLGDDSGVLETLLVSEIEGEFENITLDFKSDNSYEITSPNEPTETGTWTVSSDGRELIIDEGRSYSGIYKIKFISNTSLILNSEEIDDSQDWNSDGETEEVKIMFDLYLIK
ncbi:hypothetical protein MATR_14470 [Marivirga tractuosa]|uniref:Lipocalin-like domain-containing protein n=1 Tax=Marivirga tractuosa (strain ATCC 23168 / DSM 4126 / NBRC 15989 / NCIMB 1408 / VKM B-1430 / H-43) TaxID=643867 RepID=E4TTL0_MARTH|nr:hypothetical protein [Marivirga tractuosa]ADR20927.1 hypothetical protein Ftrac_0925 [Marivirga tractuosa DSM 4126]BDD14622.1 hypothetical protein MATR_14470 [Marivirga tractuosa]